MKNTIERIFYICDTLPDFSCNAVVYNSVDCGCREKVSAFSLFVWRLLLPLM